MRNYNDHDYDIHIDHDNNDNHDNNVTDDQHDNDVTDDDQHNLDYNDYPLLRYVSSKWP